MRLYVFLITFCLLGCSNHEEYKSELSTQENGEELAAYSISEKEVAFENLKLIREEGVWKLNGEPYSGYALKHYPNGSLKLKTGFFEGKKQGESREYFQDGHLRQITNYYKNQMHGVVRNWSGSEGHPYNAERNFYLGKPHGKHTKWYKNGQILKIMNYKMGKEEGLQQSFNENGSITANYEAKDGRSFGLRRSILCFKLDEEEIVSSRNK